MLRTPLAAGRRPLNTLLVPGAQYPAQLSPVSVDPALGPCVLELESQDCWCEWNVIQPMQGTEHVRMVRTGPAGQRVLIPVLEGARVDCRIVCRTQDFALLNGLTFSSRTGQAVSLGAASPNPWIAWRVWSPEDAPRPESMPFEAFYWSQNVPGAMDIVEGQVWANNAYFNCPRYFREILVNGSGGGTAFGYPSGALFVRTSVSGATPRLWRPGGWGIAEIGGGAWSIAVTYSTGIGTMGSLS